MTLDRASYFAGFSPMLDNNFPKTRPKIHTDTALRKGVDACTSASQTGTVHWPN